MLAAELSSYRFRSTANSRDRAIVQITIRIGAFVDGSDGPVAIEIRRDSSVGQSERHQRTREPAGGVLVEGTEEMRH